MAPKLEEAAPDALDAAADELLQELGDKPGEDGTAEPEEGGGKPAEEGGKPAEPGKQPDKKPEQGADPKPKGEQKPQGQEAEPEAGKPVPYDRFKSTLERAKAAEAALKEKLEPYEGEKGLKVQHAELKATHDRSMGNFRTLATRLAKHPALEQAVEAMVKSEDGSIPEDVLAAVVAELSKGAAKPAEGGKDPKNAPADATTREIRELRERIDQKEKLEEEARATKESAEAFTREARELKDPKSKIRESLEKKFPGLEVDKDFMEQVWARGEIEADLAERRGDPRPSLHAIAEKLAAPLFGYRQRLLGKKAADLEPRKGAGLERAGGPAGHPREKEPPFGSPEWTAWALRNKDMLTQPEDEG